MSTNTILGWSVALLVLIGGAYFLVSKNNSGTMMKDADSIATSSSEMMKAEGEMTTTSSSGAMDDGSMKKDDSGIMMDASTTMKADVMVK